jgi:asparagine synthase (glutamine-hydrolysing)
LTERLRQKLIDRGAAATDAAADQESFRGRQSFMFNLLFPFDSFARELVERLASRSGLEVRHPFYDRAFVDFALALPMRLRLRGSVQKYVHVEGLRGLMPERVRARTGKATFDGFVANVIRAASAEIEHDVPARIGAWLDGSQYRAVQKKYVEEAPEGWESWVLWNSFALSVVAFEQ